MESLKNWVVKFVMDREEVQGKLSLTPEQNKAWKALEKAVNRCKKEEIFFHQVINSLHGLNGLNVSEIEIGDRSDSCNGIVFDENRNLDLYSYPSIDLTCGFADDTHYVKFKTD